MVWTTRCPRFHEHRVVCRMQTSEPTNRSNQLGVAQQSWLGPGLQWRPHMITSNWGLTKRHGPRGQPLEQQPELHQWTCPLSGAPGCHQTFDVAVGQTNVLCICKPKINYQHKVDWINLRPKPIWDNVQQLALLHMLQAFAKSESKRHWPEKKQRTIQSRVRSVFNNKTLLSKKPNPCTCTHYVYRDIYICRYSLRMKSLYTYTYIYTHIHIHIDVDIFTLILSKKEIPEMFLVKFSSAMFV